MTDTATNRMAATTCSEQHIRKQWAFKYSVPGLERPFQLCTPKAPRSGYKTGAEMDHIDLPTYVMCGVRFQLQQ